MIETINDLSTPALVIGGILASVFAAATTGYTSFRSAKYEADKREGDLVQKELERARETITFLATQVEYWRQAALAKGHGLSDKVTG